MLDPQYILAVESSCDETAIAVIDTNGTIIQECLYSQIDIHRAYGGVVPEIASRNHIYYIQMMAQEVGKQIDIGKVVAVAATIGPGLIGSLLVGAMFAKGLAQALGVPFIATNHLEAHIFSVNIGDQAITSKLAYPNISSLFSGGHCQILIAHDIGRYELLGTTIDDAAGEAFDKSARLLGLPYPGGSMIEERARHGDAGAYRLPIGLSARKDNTDLSFSGLKTAVLHSVRKEQAAREGKLSSKFVNDIAASLQYAITASLRRSIINSMKIFHARFANLAPAQFIVCGGVSANNSIRSMIEECCREYNFVFCAPLLRYCTDNATMVAALALEYYRKQRFSDINIAPRPRWPLSDGF